MGCSFLTGYLKYDEAALAARLEALESWQRAAFALACAQRLLPLYLKYCVVTGEGDAAFAQGAAENLWRAHEDAVLAPDDLQRLIDRATQLLPPEDFVGGSGWHSYATDAIAALIYALSCQQRDLVQEAVWAARQAYDAADFYVLSRDELDVNTEEGRQRLGNDPVVQAELQRQEADLQVLERNESPKAKVKHLREAAEASPVCDLEGVE